MYSRNKGICKICGRELSRNRKWLNICSPKCYGEHLDNETIAAFEKLHNINMGDYLRKRYVEDELTIKELLRELGMPDNHRRLKRWLSRYNIKIRNKSEGVKLQQRETQVAGFNLGKWRKAMKLGLNKPKVGKVITEKLA